jgi:hypothetical protein
VFKTKVKLRSIAAVILAFAMLLSTSSCNNPFEQHMDKKPVIYLYPEQETEVTVKLNFKGSLSYTWPQYEEKVGGWQLTAYPDGHIINKADGQEYSYLFWEGESNAEYDFTTGFVVSGGDIATFLSEKLAFMGLEPKEYNEFIVYWAPILQANAYNLIRFQGEAYTDTARLDITPTPDSILRVFMAYKPLKKTVEVPEQSLSQWKRMGFAVVEWGGARID